MTRDTRLLAKIASWYYLENMNQEDIARRARLSRSTISRLLQRARDEGVVAITVNLPDKTESFLERRLEDTFGLKEAVVTTRADEEDVPAVLGRAAAGYLHRILQPGDRIGIGWGDTLWHMAQSLPAAGLHDLTWVQLTGALGATDKSGAAESVRTLASHTNGQAYVLHAPYYVDTQEALETMQSLPVIAETIEKWRNLNLAVVSVGPRDLEDCLIRYGPAVAEVVRQATALGAVGEICGRFFAGQENPDIRVPGRVPVGIPLDLLRHVDHIIGVSGGSGRAPAIYGALSHHLLDVLITDAPTARALLDLAGQRRPAGRPNLARTAAP